jgi:hypothetical protein
VLRTFRIWLANSGKHNVLYSRDSKAVTLLDFQSIGQCTNVEEAHNLDAPEMLAIFGRATSQVDPAPYYPILLIILFTLLFW